MYRRTDTAKKATVHLTPRVGTNVAVLNGIQRLLIEKNYVKQEWVKEHTLGFENLKQIVDTYTPEKVDHYDESVRRTDSSYRWKRYLG